MQTMTITGASHAQSINPFTNITICYYTYYVSTNNWNTIKHCCACKIILYLPLKPHHAAQLDANSEDHMGIASIHFLEIAFNSSKLLDTAGNCCKVLANVRNYWQLLQRFGYSFKSRLIVVHSCWFQKIVANCWKLLVAAGNRWKLLNW
jgi:hypothetical protein